jgi:hypothetical protein
MAARRWAFYRNDEDLEALRDALATGERALTYRAKADEPCRGYHTPNLR